MDKRPCHAVADAVCKRRNHPAAGGGFGLTVCNRRKPRALFRCEKGPMVCFRRNRAPCLWISGPASVYDTPLAVDSAVFDTPKPVYYPPGSVYDTPVPVYDTPRSSVSRCPTLDFWPLASLYLLYLLNLKKTLAHRTDAHRLLGSASLPPPAPPAYGLRPRFALPTRHPQRAAPSLRCAHSLCLLGGYAAELEETPKLTRKQSRPRRDGHICLAMRGQFHFKQYLRWHKSPLWEAFAPSARGKGHRGHRTLQKLH